MKWRDISFTNRRLQVRETKTGVPRTIPISTALLPYLEEARQPNGPVVPPRPDETWTYQADSMIDDLRDYLSEPKHPDKDGRPRGPKGRHENVMSEAESLDVQAAREKAEKEGRLREAFPFDSPKTAWDGLSWMPAERIGWNAWRHTFGTLLAQDGVSLDKISAWMGNTPEVCRRHYTQFMPRDKHDEEIDKLA